MLTQKIICTNQLRRGVSPRAFAQLKSNSEKRLFKAISPNPNLLVVHTAWKTADEDYPKRESVPFGDKIAIKI